MKKRSQINTETGDSKRYFVTIDGDKFEVLIYGGSSETVVVRCGKTERKFKVSRKNNPYELTVSQDNYLIPVTIEERPGELSVIYGAREGIANVRTERDLLFEKYQSTTDKDVNELTIVSPLPGLVTKLNTETGAQLKKGDGIVIIEAMKMENEIKAPRDCIVRELNVEAGKAIDKGHVIAVLE